MVRDHIQKPIRINTDKNTNFLSKVYVDYVQNEQLLIPSMTAGGRPDQNP